MPIPAFGTTASIVPNLSSAAFATARETSGSEQSPATYVAFASPRDETISLRRASLRAFSTTFAPCSTSSLAVAAPIPAVAPVITIT